MLSGVVMLRCWGVGMLRCCVLRCCGFGMLWCVDVVMLLCCKEVCADSSVSAYEIYSSNFFVFSMRIFQSFLI